MQRYTIIRMRIIQRCIIYYFLREITTKPHHWPCHLDTICANFAHVMSCTTVVTGTDYLGMTAAMTQVPLSPRLH